MRTDFHRTARLEIMSFVLILAGLLVYGTALQAQQPPLMLGVPVRPMQPPFTPLSPATSVHSTVKYAQPGALAPNDLDIQRNISRIFNSDRLLRRFGIRVTIRNQMALLTGTADTWQDYFRAENDAYAGGAQAVDNRLVVRFSY